MSVCSLPFLVSFVVALAVFQCLPNVRVRQLFFAVGSLAFLATHVPDAKSWIASAVLLISGFLVAKSLARVRPRCCRPFIL